MTSSWFQAFETAKEYSTVFQNLKDSDYSTPGAILTTTGFALADFTGVRGISEGWEGTDAVDNAELSATERFTRFSLGSIQLVATAFGVKATGSNALQGVKSWLHCFPAGTPVHTESGIQPIEAVEVGDNVWSFNHSSGNWQLEQVLNTISRPLEEPFVTIQIAGEEIEATGGHPYWVVDGEDLADRPTYDGLVPTTPEDSTLPGRWVMAIDLRVGDILWQRDGGQVAVEEISVEFKEETIYNFEVSSQHNYAVGQRGFLVHNTNQRWDRMKSTVTGWTKSFGDGWDNLFGKKQHRPQHVPVDSAGKKLPLPRNKNGELLPSSEYPHTQIGWREGRKGGYVQTREFGEGGRPVKQVDWTDHGRPGIPGHTDPHVHDYIPTGGSPKHGPARPPYPGEL